MRMTKRSGPHQDITSIKRVVSCCSHITVAVAAVVVVVVAITTTTTTADSDTATAVAAHTTREAPSTGNRTGDFGW